MIAFITGLISGGILIVIGFLLSIWWDEHKYKRDKGQKDKEIIKGIKLDLSQNISVSNKNTQILTEEIRQLENAAVVVVPLTKLQDSSWELLKFNMPDQISNNETIISAMPNVFALIGEVNETIISREAYRINNEAMSNYHNRLKIYDNILIPQLNDLTSKLTDLKLKLENI